MVLERECGDGKYRMCEELGNDIMLYVANLYHSATLPNSNGFDCKNC